MPKSKPTQVIVHRLELQEMERDLLKEYMSPKIIQGYAYAGSAAIVCLGVGLAGYSAYWFLKKTGQWAQDAKDAWDTYWGGLEGITGVDTGPIGKPNIPFIGWLL